MERGSSSDPREDAVSLPVSELFSREYRCRTLIDINPPGDACPADSSDTPTSLLLTLLVAPKEEALEIELLSWLRVDKLIDTLVTDPHREIIGIFPLYHPRDEIGTPSLLCQSRDDIRVYFWMIHRRRSSFPRSSSMVLRICPIGQIVVIRVYLLFLGILAFEYGLVTVQLSRDGSGVTTQLFGNLVLFYS